MHTAHSDLARSLVDSPALSGRNLGSKSRHTCYHFVLSLLLEVSTAPPERTAEKAQVALEQMAAHFWPDRAELAVGKDSVTGFRRVALKILRQLTLVKAKNTDGRVSRLACAATRMKRMLFAELERPAAPSTDHEITRFIRDNIEQSLEDGTPDLERLSIRHRRGYRDPVEKLWQKITDSAQVYRYAEILLTIADEMLKPQEVEDLLRHLGEVLWRGLPCNRMFCYRCADDEFYSVAEYGNAAVAPCVSEAALREILRDSLQTRESLLTLDAWGGQVHTAVCVPLVGRDERVPGLLYLDAVGESAILDERHLLLVTAAAFPAAIGVEYLSLARQILAWAAKPKMEETRRTPRRVVEKVEKEEEEAEAEEVKEGAPDATVEKLTVAVEEPTTVEKPAAQAQPMIVDAPVSARPVEEPEKPEGPDDQSVFASRILLAQMLESKEGLLTRDALQDERFDMGMSIAAQQIHATLGMPLISKDGEVLGLIHLDAVRSDRVFTDTHLELLNCVASLASLGVEHALLTEELTHRLQEFEGAPPASLQIPRKSERKLCWWERLLGDDSGRPGPLERLAAQSVTLMKALQATVGLKFIWIAHAVDIALESLAAYVHTLFRAWKTAKSAHKRLARRSPHELSRGIAAEINRTRLRLSRLFAFAGFYPEEHLDEKSADLGAPTFALRLVLEIRGELDEMKQDLSFLTSGQVAALVRQSTWDFLVGLIPNPLEVLCQWKDLVLLACVMKHSRTAVEEMYADLVCDYRQITEFLDREAAQPTPHRVAWGDYEKELLLRTGALDEGATLDACAQNCAAHIQRLIHALCSAGRLIHPRHWTRRDLLVEVKEMERIQKPNPLHCLELEGWLTREVARAMREKGVHPDRRERELRLFEARDFRERYLLQQKSSTYFW